MDRFGASHLDERINRLGEVYKALMQMNLPDERNKRERLNEEGIKTQ